MNNAMKQRKKLGQTLVEYTLLTAMVMTVGLGLSYFSSSTYRDKVYKYWVGVVAQPLPAYHR